MLFSDLTVTPVPVLFLSCQNSRNPGEARGLQNPKASEGGGGGFGRDSCQVAARLYTQRRAINFMCAHTEGRWDFVCRIMKEVEKKGEKNEERKEGK